MTPLEQLDKWIEGESLCPNDRDECCPDFSCCTPSIKTSKEVKEAFRAAYLRRDRETMEKFCMGVFLGGMLAEERPDLLVHIAGSDSKSSN